MTTYQDNQIRAILHADIPRYRCRETGKTVAPSTAKMILTVIAMHEESRITIRQIAWLCGLANSVVIYAVVVLLDQGLLERAEPSVRAVQLPTRRRGHAFAYRVHWPTVIGMPRLQLMPPTSPRKPAGVAS